MQIVELAIQQPSGFECIPLLSKYKKARTCPRVTPPALLYTGGVGRWSSPHDEERFWLVDNFSERRNGQTRSQTHHGVYTGTVGLTGRLGQRTDGGLPAECLAKWI